MTAALATFFADPWFDVILGLGIACIAYCTVAEWRGRERHIDAVVETLLPEADDVADARLLEAERQRMRAEHAVRRRDAAERRMRGAS